MGNAVKKRDIKHPNTVYVLFVCNLLTPERLCNAVLYSITLLLRLQQIVTPLAN